MLQQTWTIFLGCKYLFNDGLLSEKAYTVRDISDVSKRLYVENIIQAAAHLFGLFVYNLTNLHLKKTLFKEPIPCFTNILGLFISILLYASLFFGSVSIGYSKRNLKSQTRVNEHLQIVTTSLQWPLFVAPFWTDPEWRSPTFDGHYFGVSRVVSLYTGLTVLQKYKKCFKTNVKLCRELSLAF